jgi:hypothetical protein
MTPIDAGCLTFVVERVPAPVILISNIARYVASQQSNVLDS